jgi:hypothetical protein
MARVKRVPEAGAGVARDVSQYGIVRPIACMIWLLPSNPMKLPKLVKADMSVSLGMTTSPTEARIEARNYV